MCQLIEIYIFNSNFNLYTYCSLNGLVPGNPKVKSDYTETELSSYMVIWLPVKNTNVKGEKLNLWLSKEDYNHRRCLYPFYTMQLKFLKGIWSVSGGPWMLCSTCSFCFQFYISVCFSLVLRLSWPLRVSTTTYMYVRNVTNLYCRVSHFSYVLCVR